MSYSSLWGISKNYVGKELTKYQNAWLFSPVIFNVLPEKYIPEKTIMPGSIIFGSKSVEVWTDTNHKVNCCENTSDIICWEMANQQIFFTKDKKCIAENIRKFVEQNEKYDSISQQKTVIERFHNIADDIEGLDEDKYPYFVFKNTSCDDGVECWFRTVNEDGEEEKKTLSDWNECLAEFVVIENGKIKEFISNEKYQYQKVEKIMGKTNFEKIKDMNVQELAEFLVEVNDTYDYPCMTGEAVCKWEDCPTHEKGCTNCFREWLESEVKE